jgi:uncharacterized protein YjiK
MRLLIACLFCGNMIAQTAIKLPVLESYSLAISEPSDIAVSKDGKSLFIVSDDGALYETDLKGNSIRSNKIGIIDAEGVYADADFVYVIEERTRLLKQYSIKDFNLIRTTEIPYNGGRNKSFESLTKTSSNEWILITERDPVWMLFLNSSFEVINRVKWELPGDISAATWQNGKLWLLSDERAEVWLTDIQSKTIIKRFKLPVLNPEGIAFLSDGKMLIVSDDGHRLYVFNDPNLVQNADK